jgi:hypothetical protein
LSTATTSISVSSRTCCANCVVHVRAVSAVCVCRRDEA